MNYKLNFKSYVMFMIFDYVMLYVYGTINRALLLLSYVLYHSVFLILQLNINFHCKIIFNKLAFHKCYIRVANNKCNMQVSQISRIKFRVRFR
jgi:hypothetical protein